MEPQSKELGPCGDSKCPGCGNSLQNGIPGDEYYLRRCADCKLIFKAHHKDRRKLKLMELGADMGRFYLNKNGNDYEKTEKEIENLRITDFILNSENELEIYLSRPGLLIGRKSKNIEALQEHLGVKIKIYESESCLEWIIPRMDMDYEEDLINQEIAGDLFNLKSDKVVNALKFFGG